MQVPQSVFIAPLIAIALLSCGECRAADSCGTYRFAHYVQGLFYSRDEQGHESGVDAEVIHELARRTGCKFTQVLESRVRIWDQFRRGTLDLTLSAAPSPEREELVELVPYLKGRCFVATRAAFAPELPDADAFVATSRLKVVVVKSYSFGTRLDAWINRLRAQHRVEEASDFTVAARLFEAGRVDAIVVNPLTYPLVLKGEKASAPLYVPTWGYGEKVKVALAMSRSRVTEVDRQRLRSALGEMIRDGTVEAIVKRYVDATTAHDIVFDGKVE